MVIVTSYLLPSFNITLCLAQCGDVGTRPNEINNSCIVIGSRSVPDNLQISIVFFTLLVLDGDFNINFINTNFKITLCLAQRGDVGVRTPRDDVI
jgi:hypothetical protein